MEHPPVTEQESKYMKNSVNLCKSLWDRGSVSKKTESVSLNNYKACCRALIPPPQNRRIDRQRNIILSANLPIRPRAEYLLALKINDILILILGIAFTFHPLVWAGLCSRRR